MIRLNVIVEGFTEQTFVRSTLAGHLLPRHIYPSARMVETGRKRLLVEGSGAKRVFRGGMTTYGKAKRDIEGWIKQEGRRPEAYFSTMFDLYGLPDDFPGFAAAKSLPTPEQHVRALEEALGKDIAFPRFIPYIQLHEFEALVLADPRKIAPLFEMKETDRPIRHLLDLTQSTPPEEIDDGEQTSPSKRITQVIPEYDGAKSSVGPLIVQAIGLPGIRSKCPHFNRWLNQLEALGATNGPSPATSR